LTSLSALQFELTPIGKAIKSQGIAKRVQPETMNVQTQSRKSRKTLD